MNTPKGISQVRLTRTPTSLESLARESQSAARNSDVALGDSYIDVLFTEAAAAGKLINTYDNSGTLAARLADASYPDRYADGFVESDIAINTTGTIRLVGRNVLLSGLTPGTTYYLGTVGDVATSPAAHSQIVGRSISTTELWFHPERK